MNPELVRTGVVVVWALAIGAAVGLARWLIARRQARVLATVPPLDMPSAEDGSAPVHILVFSSDDCAQCHRLQAPAIQKVLAAQGSSVVVTEVDAPSSPDLTARYQILTLPSTVILDATGKAHAVNYGFANSTRLLQQIDHMRAMVRAEAAV